MTIDLTVHCLDKPDLKEVALGSDWTLHLLPPDTFPYEVVSYCWNPENSNGTIIVHAHQKPSVYERSMDRGLFDESVGKARFAGVDGLDLLLQSVEMSGDHVLVRADATIATALDFYPVLQGLDDWLVEVLGIAMFAKGQPTYLVDLSSTVFVNQETVSTMSGLAGALAARYRGIIYEDSTNTVGQPDVEKICATYGSLAQGFRDFLNGDSAQRKKFLADARVAAFAPKKILNSDICEPHLTTPLPKKIEYFM
jgi:hypothetical protein